MDLKEKSPTLPKNGLTLFIVCLVWDKIFQSKFLNLIFRITMEKFLRFPSETCNFREIVTWIKADLWIALLLRSVTRIQEERRYLMTYDEIVQFHGHECPGLAIGYRMATAAMETLDSLCWRRRAGSNCGKWCLRSRRSAVCYRLHLW